jgi:hypothetical protein
LEGDKMNMDKAADKLIQESCWSLIKERKVLIKLLIEMGTVCDCLYNGLDEYWITTVIGKKMVSNYQQVMIKIEKLLGDKDALD